MAASKKPSLIYYVASVMGLSSLLAFTALLAVYFWVSRPVNLSEETDRLAAALATALTDHHVPAANIQRGEALPQAENRDGVSMRWNSYDFTVELPESIAPETLKAALRKALSEQYAKLVDGERDPETGHERFSLYYNNLPFATVSLAPAPKQAAATYRSDLRNASDILAEAINRELGAMGLDPAPARAEAVEQQDLNAMWRYTRFSAALSPGMTVGALRERLEGSVAQVDATFDTAPALEPPVDLLIRIAGKPVVGIACLLPPTPPAAGPTPAPAIDTPVAGAIEGSEPEETAAGPAPEPTPEPEMVVTPVPVESPAPAGFPPGAGVLEGAAPVEAPVAAAPEPVAVTEPVANGNDPRPTETGPPPADGPVSSDYKNLPPGKVRIAILIDDGGNNSAHGDRILALDNRLTLAILPNTPFAASIAEEGAEKGFEIMLHMPMETHSATVKNVPGTVLINMEKDEIQRLTREAIDQIPHVVGINNHTGSKFTSDREKMDYVIEVLKERGLYFIDSVTINTTVAFEAARAAGIPSARRDVFLDDATDEASVRRQYERLLKIARENGAAIGIGHFQCPATARVLAEEIPKLAEAGIELVHASELVQ